ncbi:MAG: ATP-binding protein [Desulfovibrionaceae bacterium]|nr:ATP-binding protein [Desulfovibrionaceae bacterium]
MNDQWQTILEKLNKKLDSGTMRVWINPLKAEIQDGELKLIAAVPYMAKWLNENFHGVIEECARQVLGQEVKVLIKAEPKPASSEEEKKTARIQPWLPVKATALMAPKRSWRYSFGDFVEGASNRMALAAAKDVCRLNGDVQTLYVNAQSGLGKTHLAQAVGQDIQASEMTDNVDYMTAEEFAARYVASLKTHEAEDFKERLRKLDVFLLEDVHFFQNKPKIQETALGIVKNIQNHGGRVIFTSSFSPKELQQVDSQLVSSFCSGILAHIDRPDFAMRCEIIRRKTNSLKMRISDVVCELLAKHLDGDIRQLESCLNSLIFKAKVIHSEITPELAIEVLSSYAGIQVTDLTSLTNFVCEGYGIKLINVYSKSRCQVNVVGRNTIFYLARKYTDLTLKEIGQPFNKRHSSVLQGITSVERELAKGSPLGKQIARTIALVEQRAGLH